MVVAEVDAAEEGALLADATRIEFFWSGGEQDGSVVSEHTGQDLVESDVTLMERVEEFTMTTVIGKRIQ